MSFIIGLVLGFLGFVLVRKLVNRSMHKKYGNIYSGIYLEAEARNKLHKKLNQSDNDILEYRSELIKKTVPAVIYDPLVDEDTLNDVSLFISSLGDVIDE